MNDSTLLHAIRSCKAHSTPYTEPEHHALAALHGGCPVIFREADGTERQAVRLPNGEILIDYRAEISTLIKFLVNKFTAHRNQNP